MTKLSLLAVAAASAVLSVSGTAKAVNLLNDTFGSSDINSATPSAPTATKTSYEVYSTKNATNSSIAANDLKLTLNAATTSGTVAAQAKFTPVTLAAAGDYVDLTYTFTGSNLLGDNSGIYVGLDNSGGTSPASGLNNAGQTASDHVTGNAQNWVGYAGQIRNNSTLRNVTRAAQSGANNVNQDTLFTGIGASGYSTPVGVQVGSSGGTTVAPALGTDTYSETFRITLGADLASYTIQTTLTDVTTSTALVTLSSTTTASPAGQFVTTTFDALGIGVYKSGGTSAIPTMDISSLVVSTNVGTPEPASLGLLGVGGLMLARRRRMA